MFTKTFNKKIIKNIFLKKITNWICDYLVRTKKVYFKVSVEKRQTFYITNYFLTMSCPTKRALANFSNKQHSPIFHAKLIFRKKLSSAVGYSLNSALTLLVQKSVYIKPYAYHCIRITITFS